MHYHTDCRPEQAGCFEGGRQPSLWLFTSKEGREERVATKGVQIFPNKSWRVALLANRHGGLKKGLKTERRTPPRHLGWKTLTGQQEATATHSVVLSSPYNHQQRPQDIKGSLSRENRFLKVRNCCISNTILNTQNNAWHILNAHDILAIIVLL